MNLTKILGAALIGVTSLTAVVTNQTSQNEVRNEFTQSIYQEPSKLTDEQIETATPLYYSQTAFASKSNKLLPVKKNEKEDAKKDRNIKIPPAPEPAPEVRLPYPSELFKDAASAPEPKPDLRHVKPEPMQPKPDYDYPAPAPQPETIKRFNDEMNLYESQQIHKFVSKLCLPQFPLVTACVQKNKKNQQSSCFLFPCSKPRGLIADAQYTKFQQELGMNFIDTISELEILAHGIAMSYQPGSIDPKAFEKLAEYAGLDSKFIEKIEGTRNPTNYDALSQFSAQYADSLRRYENNQFPGLVVYKTYEGHLHVTGNAQEVKQIKQNF